MSLLVEHRTPMAPPDPSVRVSIMSPVRDEETHLAAMLDSVLAQTHTAFEVLLVDDGSTDRTAAIAREYADRDERVRLLGTGEALGKNAAFNLAYAHSTGDLLCHLGGDDLMPADALAARVRALGPHVGSRAVGFFKLALLVEASAGPGPSEASDTAARAETVVPRGRRGSMSGGSITMTRALAELVMPLPEHLVSEDIWMGNAADALAEVRVDATDVVTRYRRHAGNSNPRNKSFAAMDRAIHARMTAYDALLSTERFVLPEEYRHRFAAEREAERLRHEGRTLRLLHADLPPVDRIALASMSHPVLWRVRSRLLTPLTGWRGR